MDLAPSGGFAFLLLRFLKIVLKLLIIRIKYRVRGAFLFRVDKKGGAWDISARMKGGKRNGKDGKEVSIEDHGD